MKKNYYVCLVKDKDGFVTTATQIITKDLVDTTGNKLKGVKIASILHGPFDKDGKMVDVDEDEG